MTTPQPASPDAVREAVARLDANIYDRDCQAARDADTIRAHLDALTAEVERLRDGLTTATNALRLVNNRAETAEAKLAAAEADARRYRWLRDLTPCSLTLSRNDGHAINYMTAAQWIEQSPEEFADDPPEEIERMKATNTIWTIQIYPNTPVGFTRWNAATLDAAIDAIAREPQ